MTQQTAHRRRPTIAVVTAGWALLFGLVHLVWAAGWTVGLGPEADGGFSGWFLAYDLVAAAGCLVAAWWAWRPWVPGVALAAFVLVVRAVIGVGQAAADVGLGKDVLTPTSWVEVVFVVGAVLFVLRLRAARR
ncbi:hypothetical protein [Solicola sp. PLA-1-18]|uniref:hypothetical protein n=1 Tax=Solicola sp. PLA-1-18 TaxID=3380532 RepID=UPI003B783897